jgi:hypothetical protein
MRSMRQIVFGLMVAFLGGFSGLTLVQAQDVPLFIVGNVESVPNEMDMKLLRSVLLGEKQRWDDGKSIKIALMKTNTPIGKSTCNKIYDMTGNELNKYFLALVFQGKVKAPTFFNSKEELNRYIAQTPGAIGVSQEPDDDQIKTVIVEGKNQI